MGNILVIEEKLITVHCRMISGVSFLSGLLNILLTKTSRFYAADEGPRVRNVLLCRNFFQHSHISVLAQPGQGIIIKFMLCYGLGVLNNSWLTGDLNTQSVTSLTHKTL